MHDDSSQPMASYRLQFNHDFRFNDAQNLIPYFGRLGVTHLYASPILRAREASTHGYDVVDPHTINPNLGDKTDLVNLVTDLRKLDLGLFLDIVPNHMAASIENPYWRDVLTYGHSSPFSGWFDIDWRLPDPEMWGRVLVPVLGEPRARVLEQGQISLTWADGRFLVKYFDHIFPIDPSTVPLICRFGFDQLQERLGENHSVVYQARELLGRLKRLPGFAARLRRQVEIDREEIESWLAQFARLVVQSPTIQQWAEETAEQFGRGEDGRRRLRKLLDRQPYRLVHWRDAARAINYRRFFDINELVSVRQEDPHVFEETHSAIVRWVDDGLVDGLRIDHIDGLRDPLGYLERLEEAVAGCENVTKPVPIFVEKILAPTEKLPCGWPVAGTTGYEFLNQVEAVLISPEGFHQIEDEYRRMLRRPIDFNHVAAWGKRRVLRNDLSPQVGRLAETLLRLAELRAERDAAAGVLEEADTLGAAVGDVAATADGGEVTDSGLSSTTLVSLGDLTKRDFVGAIVEVVVALEVYRTYIDNVHCTVSDADRQYLERALHAGEQSGRAVPEAVEFLGRVLLLKDRDRLSEHDIHDQVTFIQRFQQLTGPAAAKGIEDTALYAYVPFVSLNEVGGEPHLPDDPLSNFHRSNEGRAARWPAHMLCVTTHDTKRSADVRARLDVLSEVPTLWTGLVRRWRRLNQSLRRRVAGKRVPDSAAEYLVYQTIVGLWPVGEGNSSGVLPGSQLDELRSRVEAYAIKAVREAKTHTSWTNQNQEYEEALLTFIRGLMNADSAEAATFLSDVDHLVARIARPGFWNSLTRTIIQFTSPGTPDLYQGDELWNFTLVDPDNRRPVDYELRQRLLDEVVTGIESLEPARYEFLESLVRNPEDGRVKLHTVRSALAARREFPQLFSQGQYLPLAVSGSKRDHVIAYARLAQSEVRPSGDGAAPTSTAAVVVVPRLTAGLVHDAVSAPVGEAVWEDTAVELPDVLHRLSWQCGLTRATLEALGNGQLPLAQAMSRFPGAILTTRRSEKI